eukprot:12249906-Ditylum_brightwellii.AAC.1
MGNYAHLEPILLSVPNKMIEVMRIAAAHCIKIISIIKVLNPLILMLRPGLKYRALRFPQDDRDWHCNLAKHYYHR